jgi:polyhydroxyalkanoate synthase
MLSDAALGPVRRLVPGLAGVRLAAQLAGRPVDTTRRSLRLTGDLAKVVLGRSTVEPPKRDRRFGDPAWTGNPLLHRLVQAYLVWAQSLEDVVDDADLSWRDEQRLRFLVHMLVDAAAPSNNPWLNPTAVKAAVDTGGRNYVTGLRQFVQDMRSSPRIPAMVDSTDFTVGGNLAVTEGAVVLRTPVFELIQYTPQSEQVRQVPLLIVPPMINKFYVADLAPGRSMIEHYVQSGQQTFTISWRNPSSEHRGWGLDTYVRCVLESLDALEDITGAERSHVLGLCAGGITTSCAGRAPGRDRAAAPHRGADPRRHAARPGPRRHRSARWSTRAPRSWRSRSRSARATSTARRSRRVRLAAPQRPHLELLGEQLPARQEAARPSTCWCGTPTPPACRRAAPRLHPDVARQRPRAPRQGDGARHPVDLSKVDVDSYVVAGQTDHICPWERCYRSVQLLGGQSRFVLSTAGHIAALVNPPSNKKSSFRVNDACPEGRRSGSRAPPSTRIVVGRPRRLAGRAVR